MSFGFNPLNAVSTAATVLGGPVGGIAAALVTQIASQMGQQVIQQLGQQLGLPQAVIDTAQGAFAGAVGDTSGAQTNLREAIDGYGQQFNGSPADIGDLQRSAEEAIHDMVSRLSEGEDFKAAKSGGRGGGWLMAMATALGKQLNQMAREMESMADRISKDTPDLTAKFGALSQQFGILFNATSNAIKTVGEGMAQAARKGG